MKNLKNKTINIVGLVIIFFLVVAGQVFAAPAINSVSGGVIVDGNSISISGLDFGVKNPAAPLRYLNFEEGINGEEVPSNEGDGGLYIEGQHQIVYDDTHQRFVGAQNLQQNFNNGVYGQRVGLQNPDTTDSSKMYVHGYWRIETHGATSRNVKFMNFYSGIDGAWQARIDAPNSTCNDVPSFMASMWPGCPRGENHVVYPGSGAWAKMLGADGEWHRMETYINLKESYRYTNVDNEQIFDIGTTDMTAGCSSSADSINSVLFGHYYTNDGGCTPTPEAERWWDELYLDITRARIELCDTPSWSSKTHCEIQIPTSWDNSSIDIDINQGSFNSGDIAYLYIVDENGNVNELGYQITIEEELIFQCGDGLDNDLDELIDYPNDSGCESEIDNDETDIIILRADINQDSQINTTDAMLTLRNSLGLEMAGTAWQISVTTGDVNCDENSNSTDAMLILRYSLGLSVSGTEWCE